MVETNKELFEKFKNVHTAYIKDYKTHEEEFNKVGKEVMEKVLHYENRLCAKTQNSGYGKYSTNLSEKFREVIRKQYPLIDFVGTKRSG